MAGLAAARALANAGRTVRILEARDRIGGRIDTRHVGAAFVDLGAAWIHGDEDNPMAEYAVSNGLRYQANEVDPELVVKNGKLVSDSDLEKAWLLFESFIEEAESIAKEIGDNASAKDAVELFLRNAQLKPSDSELSQFMIELMADSTSASTDDLSMDGVIYEWSGGFDGGDHVIKGGYQRLVEKISAGIEITLNSKVERVKYSDSEVQIYTTNDKELIASHVIVTVPLGVLKAGSIDFQPPLPTPKQQAIKKLGVGLYEKVVLVFKERFWKEEFTNSFANFEGLGIKKAFPFFMDATEIAGAPTLICLYASRFAESIQNKHKPSQIVEACMTSLKGALGNDIPPPTSTYSTAWRKDPFALGSYSYKAVGSSIEDTRELGAAVSQRLFFAGEATSLEHPSTVHGAFMSGLREAQQIDASATL